MLLPGRIGAHADRWKGRAARTGITPPGEHRLDHQASIGRAANCSQRRGSFTHCSKFLSQGVMSRWLIAAGLLFAALAAASEARAECRRSYPFGPCFASGPAYPGRGGPAYVSPGKQLLTAVVLSASPSSSTQWHGANVGYYNDTATIQRMSACKPAKCSSPALWPRALSVPPGARRPIRRPSASTPSHEAL